MTTNLGRPLGMQRVVFIGSKPIGQRILELLFEMTPSALIGVITIDDSSDSRSVLPGIREFCVDKGIGLQVARDRQHSERLIASMDADVCIVVGWYWLISHQTLASVRRHVIGVHNSLLPRYRGGSPLVWQMINGESEVGFSIFSFTEGMDDGPIWGQGSVRVERNDCVCDVLMKIERRTLEIFKSLYVGILDGTVAPSEQCHDMASYCAQRTPADGLVDWSWSADRVHDFIRAQSSPYPGAFTRLGNQSLILHRAEPFDRPYFGTPGQVARIAPEGVYVICGGNTALILQEVSLGGVIGPANQVVTSIKHRLGLTAGQAPASSPCKTIGSQS